MTVDPDHFLLTIHPGEIETREDGIHFTKECANLVLDRLIDETNSHHNLLPPKNLMN